MLLMWFPVHLRHTPVVLSIDSAINFPKKRHITWFGESRKPYIAKLMMIFYNLLYLESAPYLPKKRQKHVQPMLQLMYYCKNTGA